MAYLILLRHGESQWNLENRFTGWVDVDLSAKGLTEATSAGQKIKSYPIDKAYTSLLKRANMTLSLALENANKQNIPVIRDKALNERHYGALQGLNKAETAKMYSDEQVHIWRRSYDVVPPGGESLRQTCERVIPYFKQEILPRLKRGENVLIVAHGNSLRGLIKELEGLDAEGVVNVEIPTGVPISYDIDTKGTASNKIIYNPKELL